MMQRDTTDLAAHNKELKLKLEALEQEAKLREGICMPIWFHICLCLKKWTCAFPLSYHIELDK